MKVYRNGKRPWTAEEVQILRDQYPIKGSAIPLPFRSEKAIHSKASEMGVRSGRSGPQNRVGLTLHAAGAKLGYGSETVRRALVDIGLPSRGPFDLDDSTLARIALHLERTLHRPGKLRQGLRPLPCVCGGVPVLREDSGGAFVVCGCAARTARATSTRAARAAWMRMQSALRSAR